MGRDVTKVCATMAILSACAPSAPVVGFQIDSMHQLVSHKPAAAAPCATPGAKQSFKRVMNAGSMADFFGCPVEVEAEFVGTDTSMFALELDTSGYTLFTVAPVGEAPAQAGPLGASSVTVVAVKKGADGIVFDAKKGDKLVLRGFPDFVYVGSVAQPTSVVFNASTVARAQ